MQTFRVAKERYGWAVRVGNGVTAPFWTRAMALREANCLCEELRRHGVAAEVVVDDVGPNEETRMALQPQATYD
jgi:hypothetical protein